MKAHLVDVTMFYAPQGGGVKRYLKAKRHWLLRHSAWRHTLLIPGRRGAQHEPGCTFIASPRIPFSNGYRFPVRVARWRKHLIDLKPDLIETGDPYQLAWMAQSAGRQLDVPVVGFYHSDVARLIRLRAGSWPVAAIETYLRRLYSGFDLVFAPSRLMCDKLKAIGVDRVIYQPLGVDVQTFHPAKRDDALRQSLGLAASTKLCVFAGRFAREKNIPVLLSAFSRLGSGYHLLLIGGGSRLRPQENVTVLPYQASASKLARLIASCDLLVHAGDQETFGLVVLEAMACGLPAIGVSEGAIPELIDSEVGALVKPGRVEAFAEAISTVLNGNHRLLGLAARNRVIECYSWERSLERQMFQYRRLLHSTAATAQREPALVAG